MVYVLDFLEAEIRQAEEEQREVELSRPTAEALLEIAREAEFTNWSYSGR
jgi:hypothetical protein